MSFFGRKMGGGGGGGGGGNSEHTGHNLQDGLFQIASQACHILVQVNNTHNVSYGGSNNVNNIAYSKYSTAGGSTAPTTSSSSTTKGATTAKAYPKYAEQYNKGPNKDQDVVVLLPHRKNRAPRLKHKLSTVSENARLDVNSPGGDDDLDLWDQTGFILRTDVDDPLTHAK